MALVTTEQFKVLTYDEFCRQFAHITLPTWNIREEYLVYIGEIVKKHVEGFPLDVKEAVAYNALDAAKQRTLRAIFQDGINKSLYRLARELNQKTMDDFIE